MNTKNLQLRSLDLFHAMYVVGLAFALQEVSIALYSEIRDSIYFNNSVINALIYGLFSAAIFLLIVRFFWSVGNIRRAVEDNANGATMASDRWVVLLHLPALLIQGMLILFVSRGFADLTAGFNNALNPASWFVVATAWNTLWLKLLLKGRRKHAPEIIWIWNNSIFVIVGGALMALTYYHYISDHIFLIIFSLSSIISSVIDLMNTAEHYIVDAGK